MLRAERRAGELLAKNGLDQGRRTDLVESADEVRAKPVLTELGISRDQSSAWQQIAAIPEPAFERHIAQTKADRREKSAVAVPLSEKGPLQHPKIAPTMAILRALAWPHGQ